MPKLNRFIVAATPVLPQVRAELTAGAKQTHWIWFIFPQIAGLGTSAMSQTYAIADAAEARKFLADPILGPRLRELTGIVLATNNHTATQIFGPVDAAKFRSCMTLFAHVSGEKLFIDALDKFYAGQPDPSTLERLQEKAVLF